MHDLIIRAPWPVIDRRAITRFFCIGLCLFLSACTPTPESGRAESILRDLELGKTRPYRTFVGGTIKDYPIARYVENCLRHIERVAEANYPKAASGPQFHATLVATVAIRSDGSLESVQFDRTSGFPLLDSAAISMAKQAAPFEPFTDAIRRDIDVLHITRTWTFNRELLKGAADSWDEEGRLPARDILLSRRDVKNNQ
ncbi:MAG: TonB family protein [Betaproteobacteria bacterium]